MDPAQAITPAAPLDRASWTEWIVRNPSAPIVLDAHPASPILGIDSDPYLAGPCLNAVLHSLEDEIEDIHQANLSSIPGICSLVTLPSSWIRRTSVVL